MKWANTVGNKVPIDLLNTGLPQSSICKKKKKKKKEKEMQYL